MADIYVRFVKWASILAGVLFGFGFLIALTAGGTTEIFWSIILLPFLFLPYYLGALIPTFIYAFNAERKSAFLYVLTTIVCIFGITVAGMNFPLGSETLGISLAMISPFVIILIRTLYHWHLGY